MCASTHGKIKTLLNESPQPEIAQDSAQLCIVVVTAPHSICSRMRVLDNCDTSARVNPRCWLIFRCTQSRNVTPRCDVLGDIAAFGAASEGGRREVTVETFVLGHYQLIQTLPTRSSSRKAFLIKQRTVQKGLRHSKQTHIYANAQSLP